MFSAAKVVLHKLYTGRKFRSDEPQADMGFLEHLEELRKTLFRCCLAFAGGAAVSLCFFVKIFAWLRYPLDEAMAIDAARLAASGEKPAPALDIAAGFEALTTLLATGKLPPGAIPPPDIASGGPHVSLQVLRLIDIFSVMMDVVLFGGIALSLPFILWTVTRFVAPALTEKEKGMIKPVIAGGMALFFIGAALSFFWLMPISIQFAMSLARDFNIPFNWTATDYYSFVLMMTLMVGLVFEFPLLVIALIYVEIAKSRWLLKVWRQALVAILVVAVIFTPLGDPVSVSLLTAVLFGMYLGSILIGDRLVRRKRRRAGLPEVEPTYGEERDYTGYTDDGE